MSSLKLLFQNTVVFIKSVFISLVRLIPKYFIFLDVICEGCYFPSFPLGEFVIRVQEHLFVNVDLYPAMPLNLDLFACLFFVLEIELMT